MRTAVFDGVEIPEGLLAQEIQNHPGSTATEARAAAGHALALRALLLARARELGLSPCPEIDELGREETPDEAMVRAVLELEVEVEPPTAEECRRIYDTERARFRSPALIEASHILVEADSSDPANLAAGRAKACQIIRDLAVVGTRFADVARQASDCPSAGMGGALGQLMRGDVAPEVEAVLDTLAPGEIAAEPVRSRFGWHVLRLDRRVDGRELPFELAEPRIRLRLESRAWTVAAARYALNLVAEARGRGVALILTGEGNVGPGSATLGGLLASAEALEPWLAETDPGLAQRVCDAASQGGESIVDFVRSAIADYVATASDEDWTQVVSAARDAADPALACLAAVLRTRLAPVKQTFTLIRRIPA